MGYYNNDLCREAQQVSPLHPGLTLEITKCLPLSSLCLKPGWVTKGNDWTNLLIKLPREGN